MTRLTVAGADGGSASVDATSWHPVWVDEQGRFVDIGKLAPGEHLRSADGTHPVVTEVAHYAQTRPVYDLTIDGVHTYYVMAGETPVLVHNCGEADDDLLDFADEALSMHPDVRPNVATKITSADGEHVRFAYATDTRTGAMPPQTARAVATPAITVDVEKSGVLSNLRKRAFLLRDRHFSQS
jgi:hypothetical protein